MIASALLIYFSCELFVNGIEWVGKAFNISQSAVGSVLAAFGTALPESIVTFIAIVFGVNASQKDIGVGAALGEPLVLSTIGYAVIGICIIIFSGRRKMGSCIDVNVKKLAIANISGSMMIQATVPSALGIIFTPWILDKSLMLSAIVTFGAIIAIWTTLKIGCLSANKLSLNALLYVVFIIGFLLIKGNAF